MIFSFLPSPLEGEGAERSSAGEGAVVEFLLPKIAKDLRKKSTPHEVKLWKALRDRRFLAVKFRRQQTLGPFIVDFCSFEKKLIIELDGGGHLTTQQKLKDENRDHLPPHPSPLPRRGEGVNDQTLLPLREKVPVGRIRGYLITAQIFSLARRISARSPYFKS